MTGAPEIWAGPAQARRGYQAVRRRLTAPVDIASLVVVRILVGLILTWEVTRRFQGDGLWWDYVQPAFHFSYFGWEFLRPWPEPWLYLHMALLGLCGLGVASGAVYRLTAPLACLGFGLFFLWDQTHYLNHHYLLWLLLLLLALLPAHRSPGAGCGLGPGRTPGHGAGVGALSAAPAGGGGVPVWGRGQTGC